MRQGSGAAAVAARGLRRTFDGEIEAVRGIDLEIPSGEVFGFLGPNGAGKTTTVRMLCTLLPPSGGERDRRRPRRRRRGRAGAAADRRRAAGDRARPGADRPRAARAAVRPLRDPRRRRARADRRAAASWWGSYEAADRATKTYSGGMKRRLDLASALVHEPEVLFLDEPTTGLDPASRLAVWEEVRRINDAGTTIFLTTQYLEEADQLCDRLAIIDDGEIVAEGAPGGAQGADRARRRLGRARRRRRRGDRGGDRRACPGSSGSSTSTTRSRSTSRTAPPRSPRSCAASIASGIAGRRDRGRAALARRRLPRGDRPPARGRRAPRTSRRRRTAMTEVAPARPPGDARDHPLPGGDDPGAVHPAVLPRGEHRPGLRDLPELDPVPRTARATSPSSCRSR